MSKINDSYGFTLIEAVLIILLLAILAAVAIPRMGAVTDTKAAATAGKIKSDIRYAQELAMTRNQRYRVYFNTSPAPTPDGYAVVNDADGDGNWGEAGEFAQDPTLSGNLSVTLNSGDYAGVTVTPTGYIEFNSLGRPTVGGGTTITVFPGSYNLTIYDETGAVN